MLYYFRDRDYGVRNYRDSYHERNEYEPRGRGRSDMVSDRIGASPFDAIIDFARRHDGGNRTRDREVKHEMFVSNDQVGSIIGKKGCKINEIRSMSGASINITEVGSGGSKRGDKREFVGDPDRERVIEIFGSPEQVAIAKSLINVAVELADSERIT
ncbi:poly(rC)-binding protein 4 isoform X2 [Eurytemora carolleeae]|uniref:poly(rC)-binding protein 4 isoform X2 n=1 Tax=Eurytemora carolleeae TaxID=1294199 RepID=UPI000C75CB34|nr:poly(rC)-binding protein 4 isoform X2 [Eurytemora carolleeae]|eukprot:XP_023326321.1 poly(rC)-binding protein 4-like isoform X2 [Eurytemora affinis]